MVGSVFVVLEGGSQFGQWKGSLPRSACVASVSPQGPPHRPVLSPTLSAVQPERGTHWSCPAGQQAWQLRD